MATLPQQGMFGGGGDDHQSSCVPSVFCGGDSSSDDQSRNNHIVAALRSTQQHREEMKETGDFIAAELSKLSVQERLKAYDDVHGVGEELEETPEMIEELLLEFDQAVHAASNPTYEMAVNQNRAYVQDPSFRLQFLRANLHNVGKSVRQMMDFLEQKAKYFGNEKVAREITLEDLSPMEKELMLSNMYHIPDKPDRNGRVILYCFNLVRCEAAALVRVLYYLFINILIPMPAVQTKGCVLISYDKSKPGESRFTPDLRFSTITCGFFACLPVRCAAGHFCLKPRGGDLAPLDNLVARLLKFGLSKHSRSRFRIHYASDMELQYQLGGYGIPIDNFPLDIHGDLRRDIINTWYYNHLQQVQVGQLALLEVASRPQSTTTATHEVGSNQQQQQALEIMTRGVSSLDVLFGRGRLLQQHPGNIRFREFLEAHAEEYDEAPRNNRNKLSVSWTLELLASGVHFLKKEDDEWTKCSIEEIVPKVAQFFRTRRRSKK